MSAAEDAAVDGNRPVRIVQISDTHLSHRRAYAVPNVSAILAWIAADPPDLVVHTGDITADDPDDAAEADFARQHLQSAALPMVAIPGNHDVGGFSGDRFDAHRLDAFAQRWGSDTWARDVGAWRLVGGDVYRLGEDAHDGWLRDALRTERPTVLFLHQPVCLIHPDQPDAGDWSLPMAARASVRPLIGNGPVRVVASGHLHRYRAGELPSGVQTVWAPAASFLGTERDDGSTYRVGVVEHLLAPDGTATHRMVEPPGVTTFRLEDFAPSGSEGLRDAPLLPLSPG